MAETEKTSDPRTVMLKGVQLSYCDALSEPKATIKDGPKKFGSNFIIDGNTPEGKKNLAKANAAVEAAEMEEFGKTGVVAKIKDPKRRSFRPGSEFENDEGEIYRGYEGENVWGITAKGPGKKGSPRRPKLFDRKRELVAVEDIDDVFLAGQYCDAKLAFYCTSDEEQGGRGLFVTILAIRAHQKGPLFGTADNTKADEFDEFDDDEDDDESPF